MAKKYLKEAISIINQKPVLLVKRWITNWWQPLIYTTELWEELGPMNRAYLEKKLKYPVKLVQWHNLYITLEQYYPDFKSLGKGQKITYSLALFEEYYERTTIKYQKKLNRRRIIKLSCHAHIEPEIAEKELKARGFKGIKRLKFDYQPYLQSYSGLYLVKKNFYNDYLLLSKLKEKGIKPINIYEAQRLYGLVNNTKVIDNVSNNH